MIRPQDIANDDRQSGYDHVGFTRDVAKPYHAQVYGGKNNAAGHAWQGPARATAFEAAQDYCDHMNGQPGRPKPAARKRPAATPRTPRDKLGDDHEVQAALGVLRDARAQRRHLSQGYVYLISDGTAVKVGYSTKPEARVNELQTGNPRELLLLAKKQGTEVTEATLHNRFIDDNLILEWFRPSTALLSWFGVRWDTDKRLAWMKNARRTK